MKRSGDGDNLKAERNYENMVIEAMMLSDKQAAEVGKLEGVIDSLWTSIPTEKKIYVDVYTADLSEKRMCMLEWFDVETEENHKRRVFRKKQILVDVFASIGVLFNEVREGVMLLEDDE